MRVSEEDGKFVVREGTKMIISFSIRSWGEKEAEQNAKKALVMFKGGKTKTEVREEFPKSKPGTKIGSKIRKGAKKSPKIDCV